jgi:LPXTG-site transpeptidase (sortase) family protein
MSMHNETAAHPLLVLQRLLVIGGVACLSWYAFVATRAWRYQTTKYAVAVQRAVTPPSADAGSQVDGPLAPPSAILVGDPIGRIEVPRLHLSGVVANGDDEGTLQVAIGHLPDTPLPWEQGNSALAGHRDTFFRGLRGIRVGDDMRLLTAYGDFTYRVTRTVIVMPDDLSVLAPTPQATLTLVTCYPFSFIGHAPKRFIVQAERVDRQAILIPDGPH